MWFQIAHQYPQVTSMYMINVKKDCQCIDVYILRNNNTSNLKFVHFSFAN